jgi:hypothetical protein
MVRSVLFSVALLAILMYAILKLQSAYEEGRMSAVRVTTIDIYADRITYRNNVYSTPSLLSNGLKAVHDPPQRVELHVCSRMNVFEAVLEVVREQGYSEFEVKFPGGC